MKIQHIVYLVAYCLLSVINSNLQAQNITQPAYKKIEIIKVEGVKELESIYTLNAENKSTTIEYVDGLARPIQQVMLQASPNKKDIIQPLAYDQYGRKALDYLPYAANTTGGAYKANAINEQKAFYSNGSADKIVDDVKPYIKNEYEQSPLQRLIKAGSPGEGFQPGQKYKSTSFRTNNAADNVRLWKVDGTSSSTYAVGSLHVVEFSDEENKKVWVFTDKMGRKILERIHLDETINGQSRPFLDTYYVYNNAGRIKYMISPKAVAQMQASMSWILTATLINELVYTYIYDELGRVVEKKTPGSEPIYMIYDGSDRPILVQDANLRMSKKWYFTKYGSKQQPILEGIYTNSTYTTRLTMQNYVNTLNLNSRSMEERVSGTTFGYTNQVFPTVSIEELAYYYYDDYDLNRDGTADYSYVAQSLSSEPIASNHLRGYLTAVKKKIVGGTTWLTSIYFYDKRGNNIQILSNNQLYSTIADSKTTVSDFSGKVLISKIVKSTSATKKTTVSSTYTYDHASRIKTISDSYNGAPTIQVAAYEYNELGQLVKKNIHALSGGSATQDNIELGSADIVTSGNSKAVVALKSITLKSGFAALKGSQFSAVIKPDYLQSVDYRYDIQGRLTSINNSTLTSDSKNDDDNDLFGMEIFYNNIDNAIGNTAYFNGQISGVKWRTKTPLENNPKEASYRYTYDKSNRLKDALYLERTAGGTWGNAGAFDEKGITYDENGNILTLFRNAYISGSINTVDNLNYTYQGNQLNNITDGGSALYGHKNLTSSNSAYTYTTSGSLKSDPKKGITIDYNVLSKDERITITTVVGRYIKYSYDASGILLKKQIFDNNILKKTTDYIDGFVYEDGTLAYFGMAEGRVRNTGTGLKSEYMLTDHQGNVRISFEEQNGKAVVRQDNGYYPFGLIMAGSTVPSQPNKNLYNGGSEWQNDFADLPDYYKTHFRNYDAAIGRFIGIDVRAEENPLVTPYHYGLNNPIYYNDPLGDKEAPLRQVIEIMQNSMYGGTWTSNSSGGGGGSWWYFESNKEAEDFVWNNSLFLKEMPAWNIKIPEVQVTRIAPNKSKGSYKEVSQSKDDDIFSFAIPIALTMASGDGPLPYGDAIGAVVLAGATAYDATQRTFVTYTMTNAAGQTYVGRTSGYGNPYNIMMSRAAGHHMKVFGYGTPVLDKSTQGYLGYPAIRGREQQLIDSYGGVGSINVGNRIRGVSVYNPAYPIYHKASDIYFGNKAEYTGY